MLLDHFGPTSTSSSESEPFNATSGDAFEQTKEQVEKVATEETDKEITLEEQPPLESNNSIPNAAEKSLFTPLKFIISQWSLVFSH